MKFDKEFVEGKLFNRGVTVIAIIFAIFAVWGGLGGLSHDAKVIKNEISDNSAPSPHQSDSKKIVLAEENNASASPTTSTYTAPKPEAPVQSNPDRMN